MNSRFDNLRNGVGNRLLNSIISGNFITVGNYPYTIAITPDGRRGYVVNNGDNTVSVIDIKTNTIIGQPIIVGDFPMSIRILNNAPRAYVTNLNDNTVSVINTNTNRVIGRPIKVGTGPWELGIAPNGTNVYVLNSYAASVSVISTALNRVILPTIPVGVDPSGIVFNPSRTKAYVSNYTSGTVTIINLPFNTVGGTITLTPGLTTLALSPNGNILYVAKDDIAGNSTIYVINTLTNLVIGNIDINSYGIDYPGYLALNGNGSLLYVTNTGGSGLYVFNTATFTESYPPFGTGQYPYGFDITSNLAYVCNSGGNTVSVIQIPTN